MDFVWTKKLAVGVKEIDIQHRVLFKRIDDLLKAMEQDLGEDAGHIERFFDFLEDYAASHFKMEQKAMAVYKYPDREAHLKEHDVFTRAIDELKLTYKSGGATSELKAELKERLCDWLVNHVSEVDKALGTFLKPRAKAL
ncbi:MAG: bacteriohemerythrin [Thermodesulfobacteriota bacterium]